MQKLSVLVNYVIDQYMQILQAKTRKICEILSKKIGIGEGEIYKETQGWEKREQKWTFHPPTFQPPKSHSLFLPPMSLSLSHHVSLSLSLSLFLTPVCVSIFLPPCLSLSLSTPFSLSPTLSLSLSPHPFLSPTAFSLSLSLSASSISLSICPTPLSVCRYQFVSFSILFFNCVMQKKSGICKRVKIFN